MYKLIKNNILMICIGTLFLIVFGPSILFSNDALATSCSVGIATDGGVTLDLYPGHSSVATSNITATTDCVGGYTLFINSPQDATLYHSGDNTSLNYISAVSGTKDSPTTLSSDTYGYSLGNVSSSSATFIGLTNTPTILATTDSASSVGGDNYTISYGASVANGKIAGLYQMANNGTIVYSIVANEVITVTFDANGGTIPQGQDWAGSGNTATKDVMPNSTYGAMPTPTKAGYTFLGWSAGLPSNFQAVEYIVFDGNQYIDTDIVPSNHTTEVKFSNSSNDDMFLFSTSSGGGYYEFQTAEGTYYYGTNGIQRDGGVHVLDTARTVIYNGENGLINVDGKQLSTGYTILSNNKLMIGSRGTNSSYRFQGRVYYFKIIDKSTGTMVRNYVPCYRTNDNVIGMYDTVNKVFYTNQGSGSFDKGSDVDYVNEEMIVDENMGIEYDEDHTLSALWGHNPTVTFNANGGTVSPSTKTYNYNSNYIDLPTPAKNGYTFLGWRTKNVDYVLPSQYQEVEYLASTGTQFIELPFGFERSDKVDFDVGIDINSQSDEYMVAPKTWNNNSNRFAMGGLYNHYYTVGFGNRSTQGTELSPNETNDGDRHQWHYENSIFTISDLNLSYDGTSDTFGGITTNLKLFYGYNSNTTGKIYRYTHWKNNQKIIDLIPCYRKSDDVEGLYDAVNGVFYTNQGTGTFTKGSVLNEYVSSSTQMITNDDHTLYAMWEEE